MTQPLKARPFPAQALAAPKHVVFMFPGQSSRYAGMIDKLCAVDPRCRQVLERASSILGRDLAAHYRADNEAAYGRNVDVQIGVFLANHMFMLLMQAAGIRATASAGLSLGEWNHLVHIGALSFDDALRAVDVRGKLYDSGPRGQMASIFPLSYEELEEALTKVDGLVEITNINSPRQNVISGESAAIEQALALIDDEFYIEGVVIEREVPMHSSLFAPVAERFAEYLDALSFATPELAYRPNRTAEKLERPTKQQYVEFLSSHVAKPVLWSQTIDNLVDELGGESGDGVALVEVGPKSVLHNLLGRKWHRKTTKMFSDPRESDDAPLGEETRAHLAKTTAKLRELLQITEAPTFPLLREVRTGPHRIEAL